MPEPRRPGDVGFPGRRPAARAAGGSAGRAGRGRVRRPPARTHQRGADPVRTRAAGYRGGAGLRQLPSWRRRLHRLPLSLSGAQAALTAAETGSCASTWPPRAWPPGTGTASAPVAFVGLVYAGSTYENLFRQIQAWVSSESAPWDAVRPRPRTSRSSLYSGGCSATGSQKSSRRSARAAGTIQLSPSPGATMEPAPPWPRPWLSLRAAAASRPDADWRAL
jgi:hypothetical protein